MNELISTVVLFTSGLETWIWAAAAGAVLLLLIVLIVVIRRVRIINSAIRKLEADIQDPELTARLLSSPAIIETLIRRKGDVVISHFGVVEHLVRRLESRHRADDAKRILKLAPQEGAFDVFIAGLKKESIAQVFRSWIAEIDDFLIIRNMAMVSRGRDFNGEKARNLLSARFEEVRELSGDPEWPARYFALRILLADNDPKSIRLRKEAFSDPHPLIRKTIVMDLPEDNPDELFEILKTMVEDDPVAEVRRAARDRISKLFPQRWKLDPSRMNAVQAVHVLELLEAGSKEDENVAVSALAGPVVEARLAAARFLDKTGTLRDILTGANLGDHEDWERRLNVLSNSLSVGVSEFLDSLRSAEKTDVLLLGAKLLGEGGDATIITPLASKVFARPNPITKASDEELYHAVIKLSCTRGDETAKALMHKELAARRTDGEILAFVLPLLPTDAVSVFKDILIEFLKDPGFPAEEALLGLMTGLPPAMFLGPILEILESDRSEYSHEVRLRALKCLGGWHLDYTLQTILENLPILPLDQAREFAPLLESMNGKAFKERASLILKSPDAGIRAALIACLPATGLSSFGKEIRDGLNDADPDVRISCLRVLLDAGELKSGTSALALLRDPVDRVRMEAARAAGIESTGKFLKALEEVLRDTTESSLVRIAALEGLAISLRPESVDILVRFLNEGEDLRIELSKAMASKTDKKSITSLVEHFKDSEAVQRDLIAEVFVAMGEAGEETLINLLNENIASLQPFLADILTRTGFVEILVRRLGHRKVAIRRDAAELLAEIGTDSAYRGIVLAARDPDRDVRVKVTKALESLATPEGGKILASLENDPDRKVRRYTHWAMERIKARKLP